MVKQPDLGTALFILAVSLAMLWLAGLNLRIFSFGAISVLILAPLLIIEPNQRTKTVYDRYSFIFGTIILLVSYYRFF